MTYGDHNHYVGAWNHSHSINTNGWYQVPPGTPVTYPEMFTTVDYRKEPAVPIEQQVAEERRKRRIEAAFDAFEEHWANLVENVDYPGVVVSWALNERYFAAVRNTDAWMLTNGKSYSSIDGLTGFLIELGVEPEMVSVWS